MDPPSTVKSFKYMSSTQQPMFNVVEAPAPLHYRSSPHKNSSFQEPSFSTYLKSKDPLQKPQEDDTEISIFDAHKYFNDNTDPMKKPDMTRLSSSSTTEGYGRNFRTRSFHAATPTASSEASWNSQTGLLTNPPGGVGISLRNMDDSKKLQGSRKWAFGRRCCCTGKKSIDVKEATHTSDSEQNANNNSLYAKTKRDSITNKSVQIQHQKVVVQLPEPPRQQRISASGGFSFPILNNSNQTTKPPPPLKPIITTKPVIICSDPPRESLEVFQPMQQQSPARRNDEDDVGSDASSDLFEIESFSTQTSSYPMYRRRDSFDEAPTFNVRRFASTNDGRRGLDEPPTPSVAATECYAPSEVSIDWSVTTAEGFDRASVSTFSVSASEIGGAALMRRRMEEEEVGKSSMKKMGNGGGGLLLMSCRQEKAVSVGPPPVKCTASEGAAAKQVVGGRPPRAANKPPLGSDHSARLSLAFAA